MRKYWCALFPIYLLAAMTGCFSPAQEKTQPEKVESSDTQTDQPQLATEINSEPASFNIDSLFDLKSFKRSQGSSHSSALTGLPFLFQHDNNGFYAFFYFTKQRRLRTASPHKLVSTKEFHVITAVKNPLKITDSYLEVAETLVQLQSTINDPLLGSLDLVNQDTSSLQAEFGKPTQRFGAYAVYGSTQHVLVVHHEKGVVAGFKYLYLKELLSSFLAQNGRAQDFLTNFEAP